MKGDCYVAQNTSQRYFYGAGSHEITTGRSGPLSFLREWTGANFFYKFCNKFLIDSSY